MMGAIPEGVFASLKEGNKNALRFITWLNQVDLLGMEAQFVTEVGMSDGNQG